MSPGRGGGRVFHKRGKQGKKNCKQKALARWDEAVLPLGGQSGKKPGFETGKQKRGGAIRFVAY